MTPDGPSPGSKPLGSDMVSINYSQAYSSVSEEVLIVFKTVKGSKGKLEASESKLKRFVLQRDRTKKESNGPLVSTL